jgi:hypothetical protein
VFRVAVLAQRDAATDRQRQFDQRGEGELGISGLESRRAHGCLQSRRRISVPTLNIHIGAGMWYTREVFAPQQCFDRIAFEKGKKARKINKKGV